jgi:hypothetical protein
MKEVNEMLVGNDLHKIAEKKPWIEFFKNAARMDSIISFTIYDCFAFFFSSASLITFS